MCVEETHPALGFSFILSLRPLFIRSPPHNSIHTNQSGDYEIRVAQFFPATTSPIDTPMWDAMQWAANELVPGATFSHNMLAGSTDCRYFRHHVNTAAYGASLYHPSLDFAQVMRCYHGEDENLPLTSLQMSVHFYMLTALRVLGAIPPASSK